MTEEEYFKEGDKKTIANFIVAGERMEFEIKKALLPLGLYAYSVSGVLGSGIMKFEARPISTDNKRELEFLKEQGLIL
jgi:hypothetical protein